jgi:hypothetical protein
MPSKEEIEAAARVIAERTGLDPDGLSNISSFGSRLR